MKSNYKLIDELVERVDERNTDGEIYNLVGLSIEKCFINSVANTIGTDLKKYKVIRMNYFAVSLMQVSRDSKIPIARFTENNAIMSPAYSIFKVRDDSEILPEYLDMWFKRMEFDREATFIAVGGVRGSMPFEEFSRMKVLVPDIDTQKSVVRNYNCISERISLLKKINDNLLASMEVTLESILVDIIGDAKLSELQAIDFPNDWQCKQLCEIADCQSGYAFYKDGYDESGIRIVDLGNISRAADFVESKSDKYILPDRVNSAQYDKYRLYKDDLVMVMTDRKSTMELLGKTARIYVNEPLMLNQRVYRIRSSQLQTYLYVYLNTERVHIFHKSRSLGTAQKYVNNGDINMIPVIIPPKAIMDKLLKSFSKTWNIMERNLCEIDLLNKSKEQIILMMLSR